MENYFKYYKGYKKKTNKVLSFVVVCSILIISVLTFVVGALAMIIASAKGKSFDVILETAPIVFYMTIASVVIAILSAIALVFNKKRVKDELLWSRAKFLIDDEDNEEIELDIKVTDKVYIKGNTILALSSDEIKVVSVDKYARLEFKDSYALMDLEDYNRQLKNFLGGDLVE